MHLYVKADKLLAVIKSRDSLRIGAASQPNSDVDIKPAETCFLNF